VVERIIEMQEDSAWLVHNLTVPRAIVAAAGAAEAEEQQRRGKGGAASPIESEYEAGELL
jgi:predicted membrane-bound mannosyltransferase